MLQISHNYNGVDKEGAVKEGKLALA